MDKSMVKGLALGAVAMVVVGAGAVTGLQRMAEPTHAEVLDVKEAREQVSTPQEKCEQVLVQRRAPVQDERRVAGTLLGGVAGGLLGSQIGGGSGQKAATVVGAAAGAYTGNQVQKDMQQSDVVSSTETRCRTIQVRSEQLLGYDVRYRLAGEEATVRLSYRPGERIPVRDGQLVLEPPKTSPTASR